MRAHLIADVPVGVLLSGGVDSAALTALAASESSARVSTFSIGFAESSFDELSAARVVAERFGTDHHELVIRRDAAELLPRLVEAFDEPFADSSALPTYLVSELAAGSVKVALSGEGGDELFGGYHTYVADQIAPRLAPAAKALRGVVERLPSSSAKVSLDYKAKRFVRGAHLPPVERHQAWKEIFSPDVRAELVARRRDGVSDPLDLHRARYRETDGPEPLARLQDLDLGIYLVGRPAGEDGPGQHGPFAGGPGAVLRFGGRRAGVGLANLQVLAQPRSALRRAWPRSCLARSSAPASRDSPSRWRPARGELSRRARGPPAETLAPARIFPSRGSPDWSTPTSWAVRISAARSGG